MGAYGLVKPPYPMLVITVYGTKGTAIADWTDFEPTTSKVVLNKLADKPEMKMNFKADMSISCWGQGETAKRFMKDFEDSIINNTKPEFDARESIKTIVACSAA
ncbi:MAG: hypothetical protein M1479_01505 [Actinobacteria bacterium]|nr:hypothetical protein [Actinomycetota bacterium]MCL5770941.1 hypothetical protein [Actinomycetota bacterium]